MNLRRGLFRIWLVGSCAWFFGWLIYIWETCQQRIIPGDSEHWKQYQTFCRISLFDDWTKQPQFFTVWDYLNLAASGLALPIAALILGLAGLWAAAGFKARKDPN